MCVVLQHNAGHLPGVDGSRTTCVCQARLGISGCAASDTSPDAGGSWILLVERNMAKLNARAKQGTLSTYLAILCSRLKIGRT